MDQSLMTQVKAHLDLSRDIQERAHARHAARLDAIDPTAPGAALTLAYRQDLLWPRQDIHSARLAILHAAFYGYTDSRLLQEYAVAYCAIPLSQAHHAFLSLLNDGFLKFGDTLGQTLPGPYFPLTLSPDR